MTFAAITPALIVGAFAERIKFSAVLLFIPLWVTFVYFPIAHMVWYWAGPDAIDRCRQGPRRCARRCRQGSRASKLDAVINNAGFFIWGALDFAGGTVVHINAGIAGLVGAADRQAYRLRQDHGAAFGDHDHDRRLASVGWLVRLQRRLEPRGQWLRRACDDQHLRGDRGRGARVDVRRMGGQGQAFAARRDIGCVAGLVAVTPASGFAGPMGAIVLGLVVGPVCFFFVTTVKNAFGYDDALDVFGVHCIGGIVGAIGTGILVTPALGGVGIMDYTVGKIADYDMATQLIAQFKAVLTTLVWSGVGSAIIYKVVDVLVGLRVPAEAEREGLRYHGARGTRLHHVSKRSGRNPAPSPPSRPRFERTGVSLFEALFGSGAENSRNFRWLIGS